MANEIINKNTARRAELLDPYRVLNDQQRVFVDAIMAGRNGSTAARMAGYSNPEVQHHALLQRPTIVQALRFLHKKHEKVSDMSRKKVMDGFLEAIEMAKIQADSGVMISGWREIGRMCGYYAPEVKKIEVNVTGKRVIDKMETLRDEDLLQMIEESTNIIEAEAIEILEQKQLESDSDGPAV